MTRRWTGTGSAYEIEWGGRSWTLRVDGDRPGLTSADGTLGPRLALAGVAEVGRSAPDALSGATLVGCECRLGRVEATYAPPGWAELIVRAAWAPHGDDGIDLEVQVSTGSVGQLRRVEVLVESGVAGRFDAGSESCFVDPRDARSAGLSYDGREPDLSTWYTRPPHDLGPHLTDWELDPSLPTTRYAEFVHPQDATRRITHSPELNRQVRYGLFGYDLEKGVVLRARLRGLRLPPGLENYHVANEQYQAFLAEPPPLMT